MSEAKFKAEDAQTCDQLIAILERIQREISEELSDFLSSYKVADTAFLVFGMETAAMAMKGSFDKKTEWIYDILDHTFSRVAIVAGEPRKGDPNA